jgi:hypothetical protein
MAQDKVCPRGVELVKQAAELAAQIEGDIPDDFNAGSARFREIIASIRHECTNYDWLLSQIEYQCFEWVEQSEENRQVCISLTPEGEECPYRCIAH